MPSFHRFRHRPCSIRAHFRCPALAFMQPSDNLNLPSAFNQSVCIQPCLRNQILRLLVSYAFSAFQTLIFQGQMRQTPLHRIFLVIFRAFIFLVALPFALPSRRLQPCDKSICLPLLHSSTLQPEPCIAVFQPGHRSALLALPCLAALATSAALPCLDRLACNLSCVILAFFLPCLVSCLGPFGLALPCLLAVVKLACQASFQGRHSGFSQAPASQIYLIQP